MTSVYKILSLTFINDITDNDIYKLIIIVTFVFLYISINICSLFPDMFSIPPHVFVAKLMSHFIILIYVCLILPHLVMERNIAFSTNALFLITLYGMKYKKFLDIIMQPIVMTAYLTGFCPILLKLADK